MNDTKNTTLKVLRRAAMLACVLVSLSGCASWAQDGSNGQDDNSFIDAIAPLMVI